MIAIIDYGAGNLKNVKHALSTLKIDARITANPSDLKESSGIVLPGVGAFGEAMNRLEKAGFVNEIKSQAERGQPLLGICLGMQLLFDRSFEYGEHQGLGLIKGDIVRFQDDVKVPHMGWNQLKLNGAKKDFAINSQVGDQDYVYFVHSYFARPKHREDILHETEYGMTFTSAVQRDNVMGMQYHPEKSARVGMQILKNFGELVT
ncbi:imidazole glycerol phosphate synthase subunit HisH [Alkalibacillus aidingensis]|uniref:imidazole glycerol phosphate synthase subunit HisH n=1 Tax=Alkalibacillus aidingensis TaxID=2747607 RepID=UPI0016617376|nr:imidazole glycerol phosphate synthase subunit HisH [Alkalibacillus aidingensis]